MDIEAVLRAAAPTTGRIKRRNINAPGRVLLLADTDFLLSMPSSGGTELIIQPMATMGWTRGSGDVIELVFRFQNNGLGSPSVVSSQSMKLATSASTASGSAVLTFAATTGLTDGLKAVGTGIPAGTTVLSHTGTTVTLSQNTTGVASGANINFGEKTATLNAGPTVDVAIDWVGLDPSTWLNGMGATLVSRATDDWSALA